jgi:hypothetical protein
MATYKVIQNIEAEDKLIGPLTLRQFIYAGIAAICLYLSFLSMTKGAPYMLVIFLPIAGFTGFFAFPWGKDQPTEVWALAKLRFALKPRRRVWDQSGVKELVTINVPKRVEQHLTDGLNQDEVRSRLSALASTIDSRGWVIKNVNVNLADGTRGQAGDLSDRLVGASSLPQEVSNVDVRASDDILDEYSNPVAQHFDSMITASATAHRQLLMAQMQAPTVAVSAPMAALKTPEEILAEDATRRAAAASVKPPVTPRSQAAIINLAQNDDLDVATIARQASRDVAANDGEVVISLR